MRVATTQPGQIFVSQVGIFEALLFQQVLDQVSIRFGVENKVDLRPNFGLFFHCGMEQIFKYP